MSSGHFESKDPGLSPPAAGARPLDVVKQAPGRSAPAEGLGRKKTTTTDPEGSARSLPPLTQGTQAAQAKPLPVAGVIDADPRLNHPIKLAPVQKNRRVSTLNRSGADDHPDGPAAVTKMSQSGRRTSGRIAGDVVFTKLEPKIPEQTASSDRITARIQTRKHRNDRQPTRVNAGPAPQAPLNAKQAGQPQQIHPSAQAPSGATVAEARQPAGNHRSPPVGDSRAARPGPVIQAKAAPLESAGMPTVHRKSRGLPEDGAVGRKAERGDAAQAAPTVLPLDAPVGAGRSAESPAIRSNALSGSTDFGVQKMERHLRTAFIARFGDNAAAPSGRKVRNADANSMDSVTIRPLQRTLPSPILTALNGPFAQRRPLQPGSHAMTTGAGPAVSGADRGQISFLKAAGQLAAGPIRVQGSIGSGGSPTPAVPAADPGAAADQRPPALTSDRATGFGPSTFRPDSGVAATAAGSSYLKTAPPHAMLLTKRLPQSMPAHHQTSISTGMQNKVLFRNPGAAEKILTASGSGMPQRESIPFVQPPVYTALAPLTVQRQARHSWKVDQSYNSRLPDYRDRAAHFAPVLPIHATQPMNRARPGPIARSSGSRWSTTRPHPGVDTVFRAPADGQQPASPPATQGPDSAPTDAMDFRSPETTAGGDSIDLERLADEIYAIIERRLTIERESLGQ
jgi:hypothetical protein